jgi:hypothetical protein
MSDIADGLDRLAAILSLAFEEQLTATRSRVRADPTNAAILDLLDDQGGWVASAEIQKTVSGKAGVGERTVRDRLTSLREKKILLQDGAGTLTRYKSSGIL